MSSFILYLYICASQGAIGLQTIDVNSYDECVIVGRQAVKIGEASKFACVARG